MAKSPVPPKKTATPAPKGSRTSAAPDAGHAARRPAAKAAGKSAAARPPRKAASPRQGGWSWGRLSPERKLDIFGILLALLGLITLLSLLSPSRGSLTGAWVDLLSRVAGWGTFVLPAALLALGLWLFFRNVDRLPQLSSVRIVGIVLVYFNLLVFLHLLGGGGRELAQAGQGGGYLGYLFEALLTGAVGQAGTVVTLVAWLLIALALSFDISLIDLIAPLLKGAGRAWRARPARPTGSAAGLPDAVAAVRKAPPANELPSDFRPLAGRGGSPQSAATRPGAAAAALRPAESQPSSPSTEPSATGDPSTIPPPPAAGGTGWAQPSLEVILDPAEVVFAQVSLDTDRKKIIEETLAAFGAPARVVDVQRGPTVTRFGVEPDFVEARGQKMRVRVSKIVALIDDITLALAAPRIRIQAPVPGRNYVGIEVPNTETTRVTLREVMESESFQKIRSPLKFAVGKDVSGRPISYDLASMPHMLIAGTTGSGKSVCVNAILCCLLMDNSPADLRLVLVDPKRVELTGYNGIPHLLAPVITDADRVTSALQWMLREMDNRYRKFSRAGVRNLQEFNEKLSGEHGEHLPYLVIVIDELADLMMLAPEETERSITRLAQLARATGIHMILATQRPSVDVVTGLIKANFPARIAFAVASNVDSRVILDQPGAERLLGRGDMLFQAPDASGPARLQGVYVSDSEIQRLVDYWRLAVSTAPSPVLDLDSPVDAVPSGVPLRQNPLWDLTAAEASDPLTSEAIDLVRREGRASITMLQRRMRIGYTRAARLIDALEQRGIISQSLANSQVREVLDYGPVAPPREE